MAAIELSARPEPLLISSDTTAIVVNDMQNAFCSPGGYLDKVGFDLSRAPAAIAAVRRVIAAARTAKLLVIHSQNGFARDLHDIPAGSPWWHKSPALRHMRAHPELSGQILTEGTWDFAIIDEAAPAPGELVIRKSRPSCFAGTMLELPLAGPRNQDPGCRRYRNQRRRRMDVTGGNVARTLRRIGRGRHDGSRPRGGAPRDGLQRRALHWLGNDDRAI